MLKRWSIAAALTVAGAVAACSGSNGAGTGGGPYDACLQSLVGSSCISCLRSNCGGALGDFETGCGDYLGCICPGGDFSAPNAQSATCGSKLQESTCASSQGTGGGFACGACASACSLTGNTSSNGSTSSSGGSQNGGSSSGCSGGSVLPGTMAVSLSLTGVDLGDVDATGVADSSAWKGIGFNLDGKCTTRTSTDTCTLAAGAAYSVQDDGVNGIDNSYGANLCPIFDTESGMYSCSSAIKQAYLQTDASGTGTLVLGSLVYPVRDVHIALNGSGGMAGGVLPTAGMEAAWKNAAACISTSLCNTSAIQSVLTQLAQASDIGADGSNAADATCDGISFGIRFTGSTPVSTLPMPPSCPCP
ncbi:MAG TPA: hypothetical protein VF765_34875 [Polyangiaceae bacterium]